MNREIKFRGKGLVTGEWFYGYLQKYQETHVSRMCVCAASVRNWNDALLYEVNSDTIGQYTGKNDKDGIKIFEGDILRVDGLVLVDNQYVPTYYYGKVFWCESDCSFSVSIYRRVVDGDVGFVGGVIYMLSDSDLESYVVIGNIYDNPELIRGKQNEL